MLLGRQVGVPGRHREAVLFADERRADDPHGNVQVAHHAADHGELLRVLAAEHRHVRARDVEEFEHDREDAREMDRPERPAHDLGELRLDERDGRVGAVHLLGRRREDGVDPLGAQQREVALFVARISLEIFVRPELGRIHEDGDDDAPGLLFGEADEREVPFVQEAHRGDDGDGFSGAVPRVGEGGEGFFRAADFHGRSDSDSAARHSTPGGAEKQGRARYASPRQARRSAGERMRRVSSSTNEKRLPSFGVER